MSPFLAMVVDALIKYLETHPDQVQQLVTAGIDFLVQEVAKAKATAASAT